jgi:acyl transferase domain-containing protein/acyl carrier protein
MNTNGLEVAIIGMAGRFPDASNVDEFWQNLKNGVESVRWLTDEYLQEQGVEQTLLNNPQYVKAGAPLQDIDLFDADFFGFNPREAEILDPQQRLFLECACVALEAAGYDPQTYKGLIGVYGGAGMNGYLFNLYTNPTIRSSVSNYQIFLASDKDFLTTRVSYKLNLAGPSVDVQTACSTSLVAVHLACQSLLSGECDMALAGGVAISKQVGYLYQEGGIYSPDGHCRAFDTKAQGTVAGSGLGIVVLKRLEDALADRDCIHAVIKGSAINNDGGFKVSYTAPSIDAQAKVIRAAALMAEVEPDTISYIEAHGTGTALGDPIEMAALTQVFQASTHRQGFCAIGSLKTNIGHLDTAAGIASLIKTVLALKHKQIPPSLHFEQPNPQIDFDRSPFYVNTTLSAWQTNNLPRRAGVSSFGIGGTNAHVILEEVETKAGASLHSRPWQLLLLSAKTDSALATATANLANHLKQYPDMSLPDVAYTLQVGRQAFAHRRALVCQSLEEAKQILESPDSQELLTYTHTSAAQTVAFMFPGQGSQYVNMGRELYETEAVFKEQVDHCSELLQPYLEKDLRDIIYLDRENLEVGSGRAEVESRKSEAKIPNSVAKASVEEIFITPNLNDTAYAQPALFVIEYALAQLLMSWGIHPEVMIGHSIGEYVAATLAGVFSLADALKLVALRGQLMQQMPTGSMLSVFLSASEIQPWLNTDVALAANNSPNLCVVSGNQGAIAHLQQRLETAGITCRLLHTSHAFHSPMMTAVQEPFLEVVKTVKLHSPQINFISNVTGTWITTTQATDPTYWAKHLRQTVQFSAGLSELIKEPQRIMLEVGPGNTLLSFAKWKSESLKWKSESRSSEVEVANMFVRSRKAESGSRKVEVEVTNSEFRVPSSQFPIVLATLRHPKENQSDVAFLLKTLGKLWLTGLKIDWASFYINEQRYRVPLPTYPFERQRYWVDAQPEMIPQAMIQNQSKVSSDADWFYLPSWERNRPLEPITVELSKEKFCWLIFVDAGGTGDAIAQQLANAGHDVVTVAVGNQFTQLGYRRFSINPQHREDYVALLQDLHSRELIFERVIHLWSIDHNCDFHSSTSDFDSHQTLGFYSLLFLTQAIAQQHLTTPIQVTIITHCLYDVIGDEKLNPAKATVLGLGKVIPQEYPHIACRNIDVIISQEQHQRLIHQLLTELMNQPTDFAVAYRGWHRWRQKFQPVHDDEAPTEKVRLRSQGNYLIVGDLDKGLGLVFAKYLAQTMQAKLTLVSTALPSTEWEQTLTAAGAECLLFQADITDELQMHNAIASAEQRFGTIHGVFYSTPMSHHQSAAPIAELQQSQCEYNFRSKVYGLYVLQNVLQGKTLDFCLLQSSLSTVVGGLGLAGYAAANSFIDAFAQQQISKTLDSSISWVTVNWDACQLEPSQPTRGFAANISEFALTPEEIWQATQSVLAISSVPQVVVSKGELQARIKQWIRVEPDSATSVPASSQHTRPNLTNEYIAPRNEVEQAIANIWQELLGINLVGLNDNFFELGGHSLLAIQAIAQLRETFQIELPMRSLLFEAPTVAKIAAVIAAIQPRQDELAEMAEVLAEIQNLSPEEIAEQLTAENT